MDAADVCVEFLGGRRASEPASEPGGSDDPVSTTGVPLA